MVNSTNELARNDSVLVHLLEIDLLDNADVGDGEGGRRVAPSRGDEEL